MSAQKNKRVKVADISRCRRAYFVELARASSFITSTRSTETRAAMIDEVLADFARQHGEADVGAFLVLLVERLTERDNPAAAAEVQLRLGGPSAITPPAPAALRRPAANGASRLRRAA